MKVYVRFTLYLFLFVLLAQKCYATAQHNIGILGTGYVGLVLGACLADFGHNVVCADIDKSKIDMLNNGKMPIYEPGLQDLVLRLQTNGKLKFSADPINTIKDNEIIFIAVQTPMSDDGKADLSAIRAVATMIGENLNGYKVICTKSTVPIGTGDEIKHLIEKFSGSKYEFDMVANPEFLREGNALNDFLYPERVVIGSNAQRAVNIMHEIYRPLLDQQIPFVYTDIVTAEMIKYACNSFLAVKISFINEIANLCDVTGADVQMVSKGMGLDSRIGAKFLCPGPGFGGSCFPKDVQALLYKGKTSLIDLRVIGAALEANESQKILIYNKLLRLLNYEIEGKKIAILGLAFKANTDDVRYSPSITMIEKIQQSGGIVKAYDPVAMPTMKRIFPNLDYANSLYEAVENVDAIVILTEWDEFKKIDLKKVKTLVNQPIILDTRNILKISALRTSGFSFENIGHAQVH